MMAEKNVQGVEGIAKIKELTKDIHIAMLTTVAEDGSLHARPMATESTNFDGTLWFITRIESGKVEEIREDSHVLVSYEQPKDGMYLALQGRAGIVKDRAEIKAHWYKGADGWFENGSDDPAAALIKVKVTGGEYWQQNSTGVVRLGKLALASVLGADKVGVSDEGKITL
jgi:general stress protein 26